MDEYEHWTRAQQIRARLTAKIESAIAALDALDGDCDLEDTHDQEWVDEREFTDDFWIGSYGENQTLPPSMGLA